jgi:hypothetical protein
LQLEKENNKLNGFCDICKKNIATKNICEPTGSSPDKNGDAGYMLHYKITNSYCDCCYKEKYN